jgi:hypothetical protein
VEAHRANALTLLIVGFVVLGGVLAWGQRQFRRRAAGAGDLPAGASAGRTCAR